MSKKKLDRPSMGEVTKAQEFLGRRDAFHVPGVLVTLDGVYPAPGQKVVFVGPSTVSVYIGAGDDWQAIVDPFLSSAIKHGELFWVLPRPWTVKDLTHTFTLDSDDAVPTVQKASPKKCIVCDATPNPQNQLCDECAEYDKNDSCRGCYD